MAAKKVVSYAWARHTSVANRNPSTLRGDAYDGLEWARELADDGLARSDFRSAWVPRITVRDLALRDDVSVRHVEKAIAEARSQLFGRIGDRAIWLRVAKAEQVAERRPCAETGCSRSVVGRYLYCETHGAGAARTARCRARKASTSG